MKKIIYFAEFRKFFFFFFLFSLILVPSFSLPLFSFKIQLIDCFIPFMFLWLIWKKRLIFSLFYIKNLLLFGIIIGISIIFNFKKNAINDWFEIYEVIKYIVVFLVFKEIYQPKVKQLAIDLSFVILLIINFVHYHNLFGFNEVIMPIYCGKDSIHLLTYGYNSIGEPATRRMLGLIGNPNNNAILFLIFLIHYLPKKEWKIKEMFFFYMATIAVAACQSRTGMVAFSVIFLLNFIVIKWKWIQSILHIGIVTAMLLFFFNFELIATSLRLDFLIYKGGKNDYILSLLNKEAFRSASWKQRLVIWEDLLQQSVQKPIIGHGPQKNHFYETLLYAENEYVLMIWRCGIIGLFVYLLIYLIPLKNSFKLARSNLEAQHSLWVIILFMIAALTNVPLSHPQLSPLFFLIMGSYYANNTESRELIRLKKWTNRWFN